MTNDYTSLITSQYADSPKFNALVELLTNDLKANTELTGTIPSLFDVDTAIGQQLDFTAQWIGLSRIISPSINNVFFTWDTVNLGWEEGVWQDLYSTNGVTILDDETFRRLLKVKIILNQFNGSIPQTEEQLIIAFPDNLIVIEDKQDMTYQIGVVGYITPLDQALITRGYFDTKPAGVSVNYLRPSIIGEQFFAFDVENEALQGWDISAWAETIPAL